MCMEPLTVSVKLPIFGTVFSANQIFSLPARVIPYGSLPAVGGGVSTKGWVEVFEKPIFLGPGLVNQLLSRFLHTRTSGISTAGGFGPRLPPRVLPELSLP